MPKLNAETFLSVIRQSGLLEKEHIKRVIDEMQQAGVNVKDTDVIADYFIGHQYITQWQADKLLQGKHKGFTLGKYKLMGLLGKGGMSSVYLAEHVLMRRRCAIKVLPIKRVKDSSYLDRFYREARAVAALDHPNIIRAYDIDLEMEKDTEIHFLVMEYVNGRSLQEVVKEDGPLSVEVTAEYMRQSALGLEHAHRAGLVHRDVKPGNLLVDSFGTVKLLDLGLARFAERSDEQSLTITHDEKVLGTADYLSPEQALDSHSVDHRADIYSLGCTIYYLLTSYPPFRDGTLTQRLMFHQVKEPPSISVDRPDVPESFLAIVRKMMAKKPEDRFNSMAEVSQTLGNWLLQNGTTQWRQSHPELSGSDSNSNLQRVAQVVTAQAAPVAAPVMAVPVMTAPMIAVPVVAAPVMAAPVVAAPVMAAAVVPPPPEAAPAAVAAVASVAAALPAVQASNDSSGAGEMSPVDEVPGAFDFIKTSSESLPSSSVSVAAAVPVTAPVVAAVAIAVAPAAVASFEPSAQASWPAGQTLAAAPIAAAPIVAAAPFAATAAIAAAAPIAAMAAPVMAQAVAVPMTLAAAPPLAATFAVPTLAMAAPMTAQFPVQAALAAPVVMTAVAAPAIQTAVLPPAPQFVAEAPSFQWGQEANNDAPDEGEFVGFDQLTAPVAASPVAASPVAASPVGWSQAQPVSVAAAAPVMTQPMLAQPMHAQPMPGHVMPAQAVAAYSAAASPPGAYPSAAPVALAAPAVAAPTNPTAASAKKPLPFKIIAKVLVSGVLLVVLVAVIAFFALQDSGPPKKPKGQKAQVASIDDDATPNPNFKPTPRRISDPGVSAVAVNTPAPEPKPKPAPAPTKPIDGKVIDVGPDGHFREIWEALSYLREQKVKYDVPVSSLKDQANVTINVTGGQTYEAIAIDASGQTSKYPSGIHVIAKGAPAKLKPRDDGLAVRLLEAKHFRLENFEIDVSGRETAIEMYGYCTQSMLTKLKISGFTKTGIRGLGISGEKGKEMRIADCEFRPGNGSAVALRFLLSLTTTRHVSVQNCLFLGPQTSAIELGGEVSNLQVRHNLIEQAYVGISVLHSRNPKKLPDLSHIQIANNTFYNNSQAGIGFYQMPSSRSCNLVFNRNLFAKGGGTEMIISEGYDSAKFEKLLSDKDGKSVAKAIDQNWSDRKDAAGASQPELVTDAKQRVDAINFASVDRNSPDFLQPAAGVPFANVPNPAFNTMPFIGAKPAK